MIFFEQTEFAGDEIGAQPGSMQSTL